MKKIAISKEKIVYYLCKNQLLVMLKMYINYEKIATSFEKIAVNYEKRATSQTKLDANPHKS